MPTTTNATTKTTMSSDICNHPRCLLDCVGHDVDLDDRDSVLARLNARGFSPAQQRELHDELYWAWVEQDFAMTKYLKEGVWDGPNCQVHDQQDSDSQPPPRGQPSSSARPRVDRINVPGERNDKRNVAPPRQPDDDWAAFYAGRKRSREEALKRRSRRSSMKGPAPSQPDPSHMALTAENLSPYEQSKLACAAERIALSVRFSQSYSSETEEDKDDDDDEKTVDDDEDDHQYQNHDQPHDSEHFPYDHFGYDHRQQLISSFEHVSHSPPVPPPFVCVTASFPTAAPPTITTAAAKAGPRRWRPRPQSREQWFPMTELFANDNFGILIAD